MPFAATNVIELVSGVLLVVGGLSSVEPRWAGRALALAGLVLALLGATGLVEAMWSGWPDSGLLTALHRLRSPLAGFAGGTLVTLFMSGHLARWKRAGKR